MNAPTTIAQLAAYPLTPAPRSSSTNLAKKSCEFESILLTQWLQAAQESFGSVPGADAEDDSSTQQWMGFATQQLAKAISDRGGIGIAKMVDGALQHAADLASHQASRDK